MPPHVAKPERANADLKAWDQKAWREFAAEVTPLSTSALPRPRALPAVAPQEQKARPSRPFAPPGKSPPGLVVGTAPAGLDTATWRRFSSGELRSAATLDLHGMTAARARLALEEFLHRSADAGHRTVEVITGRGQGPEGGIIRREFPHWLNAPALRPLLLGACHPHRANPGSVLLLLRRKR